MTFFRKRHARVRELSGLKESLGREVAKQHAINDQLISSIEELYSLVSHFGTCAIKQEVPDSE